MVSALIPSIVVVLTAFVVLLLVMVLAPTVYSYRFYRRQLEAGKVEKRPVRPASVVLVLLVILAFGGFLVFTLFAGSLEITCGTDSLTVEAGGWGDLTVEYQDDPKRGILCPRPLARRFREAYQRHGQFPVFHGYLSKRPLRQLHPLYLCFL